ncbi:MAG: hypothetical protein AAGE52_23300 [Myxococcota bacterium]
MFITVFLSLLVELVGVGFLSVWARWVGRRHPELLWRRAQWLPWLGFACAVVATGLAVFLLNQAFDASSASSPGARASTLAQGISEGLNLAMFFRLPAFLLYVSSLVLSLAGTLRSPRQANAQQP